MAAPAPVVVNFSGSVWSSLMYDHSCCDGDQEGFLIGEVVCRETMNISDSQMNRKTEEVDINVTCHCPCKEPYSFYDTKGHIDQVKVLSLLKSNYKNVLGFYRFRRNTALQPSLKEMTLYHSLLSSLRGGQRSDTFLLAIFSCHSSWNLATHSYPYQLYTFGYDGFSAKKVSLINLGDTAESEYKLAPVQFSIASTSSGFQQILSNYSTQFMGQDASLSGVQTIQNLSHDIHNKLQELKQRVCDTESRLQQTNQEVYELRRRAQRQRQERSAQQRIEAQPITTNSNSNNNAGVANMQSRPEIMDFLSAAATETSTSHATNPGIRSQPVLDSSPGSPGQGGHSKNSETRERVSSELADSNKSEEVVDSKPADPFAGLFKDMKQTLSKGGKSSNFKKSNSLGSNPSSQERFDGIKCRRDESGEEAEKAGSSDAESVQSSQSRSQRQSNVSNKASHIDDDDDDDDETQIEDDGRRYRATMSPTF